MRGVTPPPVEAGDEVAMLAPSSRMPDSIVERGVERLRASFDVYPSAVADDRLPPDERAEEIQEAFESDATAVFAVTGGEDQLRLLPHLIGFLVVVAAGYVVLRMAFDILQERYTSA
jgi:muramoyltetrapeptide carboxypeptidase LdcA involved in peptidoglycan recycling